MLDNLLAQWNEVSSEFITLLDYEWFLWGLACTIAYPCLLILMNEISRRLVGSNEIFIKPLLTFRNIMLPLLLFYILLDKVSTTGTDSVFLNIIITLFWLMFLHQTLQIINVILFSEVFKFQDKMPKLLIDIARVFMVLLGTMFIVAYIWGIDVTSFLAAFGMGSIVLGFALRDVLGGLFSGLSLLSSAPFKVGDWISITDTVGKVQSIDWRAVTLKTEDDYIVIVPNATLAGNKLSNFSRPTTSFRIRMDVELAIDYPPNQAIKQLAHLAQTTAGVLPEPLPSAVIVKYNSGNSIHYQIRYHIEKFEDKTKTHTLLMASIWYLAKREKIDFTYIYKEEVEKINVPEAPVIDRLKSACLFDISDSDFISLAEKTTISTFGHQEVILNETTPQAYFYLILEGEVRQCFVQNGVHTLCNESLKVGEFFGFSSLTSTQIGTEEVKAQEDTVVALIEVERMRKVLQKNPKVADMFESILLAKNTMK